jgi:NAD(P)-dependent dehydrogenase (short-subunit alcohol dehydrogenase family)
VDVAGKVVVVTGGANGIGKALCERFHAEGAKVVVVADLDSVRGEALAAEIGERDEYEEIAWLHGGKIAGVNDSAILLAPSGV